MNYEIRNISIVEDVYDEMVSFDSLYSAYLHARKKKRYRQDVMEFAAHLEPNLINLSNHLLWETYHVGPYHPFFVTEPKKRLVMSLQFPDRVVQWAIYQVLAPFYDKKFIEDSYACRNDMGSHKAADRLTYWLHQVDRKPQPYYYLKLDISKYFYRVDHEVLEEILSRRIKDERLMRLLHIIINSEDTKFGLPAGCSPDDIDLDDWLWEVGMPIGNLTSQLFANIYLNEADQFAKHQLKCHYYIRYMDDIIILHQDKQQLRAWRDELENFLRDELRLDLNNKTAIRPINTGIEFVGYRMWPHHRRLKRSTARRIIRSFKAICTKLNDGRVTREYFDRVVASYQGLLDHCNSYGLRTKLNAIYADAAGRR